jgi:D-alanyl-lipoteichoic acid acyltransferase DltB (MBOAT superfamily)
MLFNSIHYLFFFPIVAALFFGLPPRFRTLWLVLASAYFYMVFRPAYILILVAVITIDYFSGLYIERHTGPPRKAGLLLSIASNLGILFVFKYYAFASDNIALLSRLVGVPEAVAPPALQLLLPIGLSFHTFQSLAYVLEVYYGRYPAERNALRFALYVLFFPQMVAGPIERPQGLLRQLHLGNPFSYERAVQGLRLVLVGFWYKVLVADNLAPYVDTIYGNPAAATGFTATLATISFALQIYCDFCGYSLIAIGSAKVLGIDLARNFDHPYRARTFADFWRRWHISLSTWFRDYVYVPLGGSRVGASLRDRNILVVFMLSGLWHGAAWTYVVWGALHGVYLIAENRLAERIGRLPHSAGFAYRGLVLALVCLAWVFFRAPSLSDAATILSAIALEWSTLGQELEAAAAALGSYGSALNGVVVGTIGYTALIVLDRATSFEWPAMPRRFRLTLYYAMVSGIMVFGKFESRSFIYFQF